MSFSALSAAAEESASDAAVSCSQLSRSSPAARLSWPSRPLTRARGLQRGAPDSSDALTWSRRLCIAARCFSTNANLASAEAFASEAAAIVGRAERSTCARRAASAFWRCFSASAAAASVAPSARASASSFDLIFLTPPGANAACRPRSRVSAAAALDLSRTLVSTGASAASSVRRNVLDASADRAGIAPCFHLLDEPAVARASAVVQRACRALSAAAGFLDAPRQPRRRRRASDCALERAALTNLPLRFCDGLAASGGEAAQLRGDARVRGFRRLELLKHARVQLKQLRALLHRLLEHRARGTRRERRGLGGGSPAAVAGAAVGVSSELTGAERPRQHAGAGLAADGAGGARPPQPCAVAWRSAPMSASSPRGELGLFSSCARCDRAAPRRAGAPPGGEGGSVAPTAAATSDESFVENQLSVLRLRESTLAALALASARRPLRHLRR